MLGEGGMGAVYEAMPTDRPNERYAVKVLHDEMSANPTVVERFLAEGDMCRRLDHPGILRVFDVGHDKGVPYLVMELLEGRALIEYTEHQQRLPVNFAVTVCAGVLHALDYAHSRGIIHRDLKPENVFLVPGPGGHWQTKLLDFGIARAIDAAGGGRRRTATGVLLGTPGYMSPEQVKAARNVDHRTDLWAVGVMFYEMVAGASAFPSDGDDPNNIWGLISAVLTKEPVPLSLFDRHLQPFEEFIKRALCKDLDHRYATAQQMSEDLLRIARGEIRTSDPQSPNASPFTREQKMVPINSRGELAAIPGVGDLGATQWAPPPAAGVQSTMPARRAGARRAGARDERTDPAWHGPAGARPRHRRFVSVAADADGCTARQHGAGSTGTNPGAQPRRDSARRARLATQRTAQTDSRHGAERIPPTPGSCSGRSIAARRRAPRRRRSRLRRQRGALDHPRRCAHCRARGRSCVGAALNHTHR
jgi:serine/threonine protein kinase